MSTTESPSPAAPSPGAGAAGLTSFPLALLCLSGSSVLTGSTYVYPLVVAIDSGALSLKITLALSALVSAGFAFLALLLARRGMAQLSAGDPAWVAPVLRAAAFLAVVALVLKVFLGVLVLVGGNDYNGPTRGVG